MITWATCTPLGPSSRAMDCASARAPELGTARLAKRAAAERRSGAGEQDRAVALRDHAPGGRLSDQEPGETPDPPALLELARFDLQDAAGAEGPGIEHHDLGRAEVLLDLCEQPVHRRLVGGIAGINLGVLDRLPCQQLFQTLLGARRQRHGHAGAREPLDQGEAEPRPDAHDRRHLLAAHRFSPLAFRLPSPPA